MTNDGIDAHDDGGSADAEIGRLAREFEACSVSRFGHAEHLTVALWFLSRLPEAEATRRVRDGLRKLAALGGGDRYNETMTLFWLAAVAGFLRRAERGLTLPILRARLLERYADARLVFDYYSPELLHSREAKHSRAGPDLKPLDF